MRQVLRRCKGGQVRSDGVRCAADVDLRGERFDASLLVTNAHVVKVSIEQSGLQSLTFLGCTFGSGDAGAFSIRDSTIDGPIVVRADSLPAEIPSKSIDPSSYADDLKAKSCEPEVSVEKGAIPLSVEIARSRVNGDIAFESLDLLSSFSIHDVSVAGAVRLDRSRFRKSLNLQGAKAQVISATGAHFEGSARMFRTTVERDAVFECARFDSDVNMTGFTAGGMLSLRRARFFAVEPRSSDTLAPIALDSVRVQGMSLAGAGFKGSPSLTDIHAEWLLMSTTCADRPIKFGGGKVDRLVIFSPDSWRRRSQHDVDLTSSADYPEYRTEGLGRVAIGTIDPDEVGHPQGAPAAAEIRLTHMLQFLRSSWDSLETYDVVEREYRSNGKLLWANHIAFCAAARKSNPFLGVVGRLRHFSPETPILAGIVLFLMELILLARSGIRPSGNAFVNAARALVEAAQLGEEDVRRALLRQRLLQTPKPMTKESQLTSLPTNLSPLEHGMALALLRAEAKGNSKATVALERELHRIEEHFDCLPTRNPWKLLAFAGADILVLVKFGPSKEYEPVRSTLNGLHVVVRVLLGGVFAWAVAIVSSYVL
jgi:hypothetical protein